MQITKYTCNLPVSRFSAISIELESQNLVPTFLNSSASPTNPQHIPNIGNLATFLIVKHPLTIMLPPAVDSSRPIPAWTLGSDSHRRLWCDLSWGGDVGIQLALELTSGTKVRR